MRLGAVFRQEGLGRSQCSSLSQLAVIVKGNCKAAAYTKTSLYNCMIVKVKYPHTFDHTVYDIQ